MRRYFSIILLLATSALFTLHSVAIANSATETYGPCAFGYATKKIPGTNIASVCVPYKNADGSFDDNGPYVQIKDPTENAAADFPEGVLAFGRVCAPSDLGITRIDPAGRELICQAKYGQNLWFSDAIYQNLLNYLPLKPVVQTQTPAPNSQIQTTNQPQETNTPISEIFITAIAITAALIVRPISQSSGATDQPQKASAPDTGVLALETERRRYRKPNFEGSRFDTFMYRLLVYLQIHLKSLYEVFTDGNYLRAGLGFRYKYFSLVLIVISAVPITFVIDDPFKEPVIWFSLLAAIGIIDMFSGFIAAIIATLIFLPTIPTSKDAFLLVLLILLIPLVPMFTATGIRGIDWRKEQRTGFERITDLFLGPLIAAWLSIQQFKLLIELLPESSESNKEPVLFAIIFTLSFSRYLVQPLINSRFMESRANIEIAPLPEKKQSQLISISVMAFQSYLIYKLFTFSQYLELAQISFVIALFLIPKILKLFIVRRSPKFHLINLRGSLKIAIVVLVDILVENLTETPDQMRLLVAFTLVFIMNLIEVFVSQPPNKNNWHTATKTRYIYVLGAICVFLFLTLNVLRSI